MNLKPELAKIILDPVWNFDIENSKNCHSTTSNWGVGMREPNQVTWTPAITIKAKKRWRFSVKKALPQLFSNYGMWQVTDKVRLKNLPFRVDCDTKLLVDVDLWSHVHGQNKHHPEGNEGVEWMMNHLNWLGISQDLFWWDGLVFRAQSNKTFRCLYRRLGQSS